MAGKLHQIRVGINIAEHDFNIKIKQAEKWLQSKDQVKIMVVLKGREKGRPETAVKLLNRFAETLSKFGAMQKPPSDFNLVITLNPKK